METHFNKIINATLRGTSDIDQLLAAIFGIALTTRGSRFLELGVRSGCSTTPLLLASKLIGGRLTSVDIQTPSYKCSEDLFAHWNFVKMDAIEFLEKNEEKFDLVFVDDWHDGKHVARELELIDSFSDKNTVIILHDLMYHMHPNYNDSENGDRFGLGGGEFANGGPHRAVSSLSKDKWEYSTLPFNNGLTILRKII